MRCFGHEGTHKYTLERLCFWAGLGVSWRLCYDFKFSEKIIWIKSVSVHLQRVYFFKMINNCFFLLPASDCWWPGWWLMEPHWWFMLQESSSNPTAEWDTADASGQGKVGVVADGGFWHLHQEGCSAVASRFRCGGFAVSGDGKMYYMYYNMESFHSHSLR